MGWSGVKNGALLMMAGAEFDVFVTSDRNLSFQQNVANLPLAVVVLQSATLRLDDTAPLMPALLTALTTLQPRTVIKIGRP